MQIKEQYLSKKAQSTKHCRQIEQRIAQLQEEIQKLRHQRETCVHEAHPIRLSVHIDTEAV